jgi:hypothetical protein
MPVTKLTHAEEVQIDKMFHTPKSAEKIDVVTQEKVPPTPTPIPTPTPTPIPTPTPTPTPTPNHIEVNDNMCSDYEIEQIISESIVYPENSHHESTICNLVKTESELQKEISNSNSSLKYVIIYIICNIPIIIINLMLRPKSGASSKAKSTLGSDSLNPTNLSMFSNVLSEFGGYTSPFSTSYSNDGPLQ